MKNAKKSKVNRKLATKKRSRTTNKTAVTQNLKSPLGYPDVQYTQVRYCDLIQLTGTTAQYTFRGNSLFDPDFTGTGHQPYYYDQYIAVYQRYRVISTSFTMRVANSSISGTTSEVVVAPTSLVPTLTSLAQAKEDPRAGTTGILPPYQSVTKTVSLTNSTQQVIGLETKKEVYDADYAALFNANPVQLWYYAIYGYSPTTAGLSVDIDIEITYNCEFFDRAPIALSLDQQIERLQTLSFARKIQARKK